jgi:colanic acid/amylovoran biosynthesis protein
MRLAITNSVSLNGGDAAITLALHDALRRSFPASQLEVHDNYALAARSYYPEVTWKTPTAALLGDRLPIPKLGATRQRLAEARILASIGSRLRKGSRWRSAEEEAFLQDIAQIDVMVSTGGTYLVEQYQLDSRLFEYRVASALGIPVLFFTQSLGPFNRRRNRRFLRTIFEQSPLILLRDHESLVHMHGLGGVNYATEVVADAVFVEASESCEFPVRRRAGDDWRIGISVRTWPPGAAFEHPEVARFTQALRETVTSVVRRLPAQVTFISTCQGVPEYRIDDSALALHIIRDLPADVKERVEVDVGFHTPRGFREIVAEFDFMIATRMHAMIQALTVGTPVVPIAYEFKTRQLAERLGIDGYTLDIGAVSGQALIGAVERFIADLDRLREPLGRDIRGQRSEALRGIQVLSESIRRHVALASSRPPGS